MSIEKSKTSSILGAAFLMATSAIGPGFLTQTTVFTERMLTSFGFVIVLSVLIDLCVQFNIWQVLVVSGKRAQDLANALFPGLGFLLATLIVIGGLAFNIGNVAGAGLGIQAIFGIPVEEGAGISAVIAIAIFSFREALHLMDAFARYLGIVMLLLIIYVAWISHPPLIPALKNSIIPEQFDALATITLVGGTVGGYISFAGAHRLLDGGLKGVEAIPEVNRSAGIGILVTAAVRYLLFLATLGVVTASVHLDPGNPAKSVFESAAGALGGILFGIMIWSAAITSVIGSAYASVSFLRTFHPYFDKYSSRMIILFIAISTVIFLSIGQPVRILVFVGTLNGFILPIALAIILVASRKSRLVGTYQHPLLLQLIGWLVVVVLVVMGIQSI